MIRRFVRLSCLLLFAAIALLVFVQPSSAAASKNDLQDCGQTAAPERIIAACTQVLTLKTLKAPLRSGVYLVRGRAYATKGDTDHAIADYDEAFRLNPTEPLAMAVTFRGAAYHLKGDYDRAIVNYDQAIRLDP